MGKDVGRLVVSVSCGRRRRSGPPLSVVLFYRGLRSRQLCASRRQL